MKSLRIALIWIDYGNYHLARLRAVQEYLGEHCVGIELVGGLGDPNALGLPFRVRERKGLNILTLFPDRNLEDIPSWELSHRLWKALKEFAPDHIGLCGYHRTENLIALAWAKLTGRQTILLYESKRDDSARNTIREGLKGWIVRQFDSYLVGGTFHRQYLTELGADPKRVFLGYDVVDNSFFARVAQEAKGQSDRLRGDLGLPEHYFLAVGRFVPKKNFSMLLEAYRQYRILQPAGWGLVICGGGPLEAELKAFVAERRIPGVLFPGYASGQLLGSYYGLASCFVHPSTLEQWGLVVNEAMAAGLPILVSKVCGCAPDLVEETINGFTFDPQDPETLAQFMLSMTVEQSRLKAMGQASQNIIQKFAPATFAENLVLAVQSSP
jgi:glycosyltransferase involved in cell wall biosynthesis